MILRYSIEGNYAATYTASKKVNDKDHAIRITISLGLLNIRAGYRKYTRPILYTDDNKLVEYLEIK